MSSLSERIDTHAHFVPPVWRTALEENGHAQPDGIPAIPAWTEQGHLQLMAELSIRKSFLSITSPGVHLKPGGDASARRLARECNEYAADLKRRYPAQFGFFASVPLPDVSGAVAEVHHAFNNLDADGAIVLTNHHGRYLGDSSFAPLWSELDQRSAIVFIHPTSPCVHHSQGRCHSAAPLDQYPRPMFEFIFDTTRSIIDLFLSGTIRRFPNIKWLVSHAGGALPLLIERFTTIPPLLGLSMGGETAESIKTALREKFFFDLAGMPYPAVIRSLLMYVGVENITYGSDFPFTPAIGVKGLLREMDEWLPKVWDDEKERRRILSGNAERLFEMGIEPVNSEQKATHL